MNKLLTHRFLLNKIKLYICNKSKLILCYIPLLLTLLNLSSCVYYRTSLEKEYRKQGDLAYKNQNYQEALDYYKKTQRVSQNRVSEFRIAELQIRLQEYANARKKINKLLRRDKKNILVKELDAYWYFATGNIEQSLSLYKLLEEQTPFNGRILTNIGMIYSKQNKVSLAIEYFNKAAQVKILPLNILQEFLQNLALLVENNNITEVNALSEANSVPSEANTALTEANTPVTMQTTPVEANAPVTPQTIPAEANTPVTPQTIPAEANTPVVSSTNSTDKNISTQTNAKEQFLLEETNSLYLTTVIDNYIKAFNKDEITISFMYDIAKLVEKNYISYSYPIYKTIAEYKAKEDNLSELQLTNEANFIIAEMIFSKKFVPLDVDPVQTAIFMLERALENGYGDRKTEWDKLKNLREKYIPTSVLQKRISQLYYDNEIISRSELENDQKNTEFSTTNEVDKSTENAKKKNTN